MINYALPTALEVGGVSREIRSDFRAVLDIISALNDPELSETEKVIASLSMFFVDDVPFSLYDEAQERMGWFVDCGRDPQTGTGKRPPKLMDWEQDFPLIIGPVNRVLGFEARAAEYLHWWTFVGAYNDIGDCAFAQVVHIRDLKARGKPLDKPDRDWYNRNRDIVDFKTKYTDAEDAAIRELLGG